MARTSTVDVLDTFRFQIEMEGTIRAGFTSCSAPSIEIQMKDYRQAGSHMNPNKIVQGASYPDITLTRGVYTDIDFASWIKKVFDTNTQGVLQSDQRRTLKIHQYDRRGVRVKSYILRECIPSYFKVGSDYNALEDNLSMEELKLAYEGFEIDLGSTKSAIRNLIDNILSPSKAVEQLNNPTPTNDTIDLSKLDRLSRTS